MSVEMNRTSPEIKTLMLPIGIELGGPGLKELRSRMAANEERMQNTAAVLERGTFEFHGEMVSLTEGQKERREAEVKHLGRLLESFRMDIEYSAARMELDGKTYMSYHTHFGEYSLRTEKIKVEAARKRKQKERRARFSQPSR